MQALAASGLDLLAANDRGQPCGGAAGGGGEGVEAWGVSPAPLLAGRRRQKFRWLENGGVGSLTGSRDTDGGDLKGAAADGGSGERKENGL